MTEIKDDRGQLVFNVIKVGMVCDRCKGTDQADQCNHPRLRARCRAPAPFSRTRSTDLPEWNDEEGISKVKAIMGACARPLVHPDLRSRRPHHAAAARNHGRGM